MFIEIIQRHNHQGFGAGNFKVNFYLLIFVSCAFKFKIVKEFSILNLFFIYRKTKNFANFSVLR